MPARDEDRQGSDQKRRGIEGQKDGRGGGKNHYPAGRNCRAARAGREPVDAPSNHVEHAQLARDVDHHGQRRHKCENGREAGGEGGGGRRLDGGERHAAGNQDS